MKIGLRWVRFGGWAVAAAWVVVTVGMSGRREAAHHRQSLVEAVAGCNPATQNQIVKGAIEVALAACIAEHAEIEDVEELRTACKWADELAPYVKELLAARKKGIAKVRAASAQHCGPDGGK